MSENLLHAPAFWIILYSWCILISLIFSCWVYVKIKDIKDVSKNLSYCKISDHILKITGFNMILSVFYYSYILSSTIVLLECMSKGECKNQSVTQYNYIKAIPILLNSMFQIYEWETMKLIINW